jgi:hypothetical protein
MSFSSSDADASSVGLGRGRVASGAVERLDCPRCNLSIMPPAPWMVLEYCPRCVARARRLVRLVSTTLEAATAPVRPAGEHALAVDGDAPPGQIGAREQSQDRFA